MPTSTAPRRTVRPVLAVVALAIALIAGACDFGGEADSVARINATRADAGLPALTVSDELTASARATAAHLARIGRLEHTADLGQRLPGVVVGENVGKAGSVARIHELFVASPPHYRNMTDARFTRVGVGVAHAPDGSVYVVQQYAG